MDIRNDVRIFSAFPCVGKTYATEYINSNEKCKKLGIVAADIDSADYHWVSPGVENPNWMRDYLEAIKYTMSHNCVKYIFVSSHESTRRLLDEAKIPYEIVIPDGTEFMREEVKNRLIDRGSSERLVQIVDSNYMNWICDILENDSKHKIHLMKHNEFILDLIRKDFE